MVQIYTAEHCNFSTMAKEYLDKKGVVYEEKPIEDDVYLRELADLGRFGTPLIIVDGKEVVGFDEERLEELLND